MTMIPLTRSFSASDLDSSRPRTLTGDGSITRVVDIDKIHHAALWLEQSNSASSLESVSKERDEYYNQIKALLQAVSAVSQLAAMEPSEYQMSMRTKPRTKTQCSKISGEDGESPAAENAPSSYWQVMRSLEVIQDSYKLEDTPVPTLLESVQRFQSNVCTMQSELDQQVTEIQSLQQQVADLTSEKAKLKKLVKRVHLKNEKLSKSLKARHKERKTLVQHIRDYVRQVQEAEQKQSELSELNDFYKLKAHEQQLLLHANSRVRASSADSNLSADLSCPATPTPPDGDQQHRGSGISTSYAETDTDVSIHSRCSLASSVASHGLVTDDGIATIHFRPDVEAVEPEPYLMRFSCTARLGLKIRPIPLELKEERTTGARTPPRGLLTDAVFGGNTVDDSRHGVSVAAPPANFDHQQHGLGGLNNALSSLLRLGEGSHHQHDSNHRSSNLDNSQGEQQLAHGFVVCGFENFDTKLNPVEPAIGARIVEINGKPVSEQWSMSDFTSRLKQSHEDEEGTVVVTFRNDPLSAKQREMIHMPSKEYAELRSKQKKAAASACSSPPRPPTTVTQPHLPGPFPGFQLGGFMNMGGQGQNNNNHSDKSQGHNKNPPMDFSIGSLRAAVSNGAPQNHNHTGNRERTRSQGSPPQEQRKGPDLGLGGLRSAMTKHMSGGDAPSTRKELPPQQRSNNSNRPPEFGFGTLRAVVNGSSTSNGQRQQNNPATARAGQGGRQLQHPRSSFGDSWKAAVSNVKNIGNNEGGAPRPSSPRRAMGQNPNGGAPRPNSCSRGPPSGHPSSQVRGSGPKPSSPRGPPGHPGSGARGGPSNANSFQRPPGQPDARGGSPKPNSPRGSLGHPPKGNHRGGANSPRGPPQSGHPMPPSSRPAPSKWPDSPPRKQEFVVNRDEVHDTDGSEQGSIAATERTDDGARAEPSTATEQLVEEKSTSDEATPKPEHAPPPVQKATADACSSSSAPEAATASSPKNAGNWWQLVNK